MQNKYPENIMKLLREKKDLDENDTSLDEEINKMEPIKVFEEISIWHGFYGWDKTIISWINDIFKIDLNKISDLNKHGVED